MAYDHPCCLAVGENPSDSGLHRSVSVGQDRNRTLSFRVCTVSVKGVQSSNPAEMTNGEYEGARIDNSRKLETTGISLFWSHVRGYSRKRDGTIVVSIGIKMDGFIQSGVSRPTISQAVFNVQGSKG